MKYAVCNELYVDWPLDKAFEHAAKAGYTGIEIAPFTLGEHVSLIDKEVRTQVRDLAAENNLEIVGLHWLLAKTKGLHLTTSAEVVRIETAEYLKELAVLCADLGGNVMVLGSPQQRNLDPETSLDVGMQRAAEVIRHLLPTLEEHEVTLALEPLGPEEGNFLLTADEAVQLIHEIESPFVQLHLDVKAMSTEPTPIPDIIQKHRDHIAHFHANDPNRRGPGMGDVDFAPIFDALNNIDYRGWISVEVFDYEPGVDSLVIDSLEYMRQFSEPK